MADAKKSKKTAKTDKTVDNDVARRIWLAGVGAYGQAYEAAQSTAGKLADKAGAAFDELVAKGEALEDQVRASIAKDPNGKKVVALAGETAKKAKTFREEQRAVLETRIAGVRKSLGDTLAPFNIAALSQAVATLTDKVDALTAEVASLKAEKAAPKKLAAPKAEDAAA